MEFARLAGSARHRPGEGGVDWEKVGREHARAGSRPGCAPSCCSTRWPTQLERDGRRARGRPRGRAPGDAHAAYRSPRFEGNLAKSGGLERVRRDAAPRARGGRRSCGRTSRPREREHADSDRRRADRPRRARLRHLLAPAQGQRHLPRREPIDDHHGVAGHRPDALPRGREPGEGHLPVHQLAGRLGHRRPGDLRHHAVRQARRGDHLHRPGRVDGAPCCSPAAPRASDSPCPTRGC